MKSELVQFETADRLLLPGLLYEPGRKTKRAAIYLHGMGSSVFYSIVKTNQLAKSLTNNGIAFLPFNNRGAHLIQKLKIAHSKTPESKIIGMSYELIKDCIKDIDGAIKYLKSRGYRDVYLIGHSTGANKICVYNFYKPRNYIKKYVLLGGGDDTGLSFQALGQAKFSKVLRQTKQAIRNRQGHKLATSKLYDDEEFFSNQAAYDILNPDGDYNTFPFLEVMGKAKLSTKPLFRHYKSITKPTLVVYGSEDEYCYGKVEECLKILEKHTTVPDKFNFQIIKAADHGFYGKEKLMAKTIADWL